MSEAHKRSGLARRIHLAALWLACAGLAVALLRSRHARLGDESVHYATPQAMPLLARHTGEIVFHNRPLVECLRTLADRTKVTVQVDWPGLGDLGLSQGTRVTLVLPDLPLDEAIRLLPEGVAGKLFALEQDGHVLIAAGDAPANDISVLRVYDVSDLLADHLSFFRVWTPYFRGASGGYRPDTRSWDQVQTDAYQSATAELSRIIAVVIGPSRQNPIDVQFFRGWMMVREPEQWQYKVVQALRILRDQPTAWIGHSSTTPADDLYDDASHERLMRPLPAMHFRQTQLADALLEVGRQARVSIIMHEPPGEADAAKNVFYAPISADLEPMTLRAAVNRLLSMAPPDANGDVLGWRSEQGSIGIDYGTLPEIISVTRTYDVRPLLISERDAIERQRPSESNLFTPFQVKNSVESGFTAFIEKHLDGLAPGEIRRMSLWGGRLVVSGTPAAHEKLVGVLASLRLSAATRPTTHPASIPGDAP